MSDKNRDECCLRQVYADLPTNEYGLVPGQLWVDNGVIKVFGCQPNTLDVTKVAKRISGIIQTGEKTGQ